MADSTASAHAPDGDRAVAVPRDGTLVGLGRALRPRQWIKNLLVLAAPLAAADELTVDVATVLAIAGTIVAFCLASSAGYLVNDSRDAPQDRLHETKRHRPIAAGTVPVRLALSTAAGLVVVALAVAWAVAGWPLALVIVAYLAVTLSYTLWLKNEPVLDLAMVSAGFLLRAVAGGVAVDVALSEWFLLVAAFGSLFMVVGKRYADVVADPPRTSPGRPVYTAGYLRLVLGTAGTSTVVFYALWSVNVGASGEAGLWAPLSVAPFTLAILRYTIDVDGGRTGAPEDVVLRDRGLQALGVIWLATFALAVFLG